MNGTVGVDDLTELWNAGAVSLPTIAAQYSSAAGNLHYAQYCGLGASSRFDRTELGTSPVWEPLHELAVLLQDRVMAKSSDNCVAAGEVLVKIADALATTDNLNAKELRQYENFKTKIGKGANPPPDVPEAPGSDDPHAQGYIPSPDPIGRY